MRKGVASLKVDHYAFEKGLRKYCSAEIQYQTNQLAKVGKIIISKSNAQIPIVTGTLMGSAYVGRVDKSDTPTLRLGYGGPADKVNPISGKKASEYAIYVHENLEAKHLVGNAKFLENAIREVMGDIEKILASFKRR